MVGLKIEGVASVNMLAEVVKSTCGRFNGGMLTARLQCTALRTIFRISRRIREGLSPGEQIRVERFVVRSLRRNESFCFSPFIFSTENTVHRARSK